MCNRFFIIHPELSLITLHWFLTSFASVVDIRLLLRIWDLLFYEGSLVLFQVTLGMLKIKVATLLYFTLLLNLNGLIRFAFCLKCFIYFINVFLFPLQLL